MQKEKRRKKRTVKKKEKKRESRRAKGVEIMEGKSEGEKRKNSKEKK